MYAYGTQWPAHASATRRGSVAAGLFLVLTGALFLFARAVPQAAWWELWPLLIVIAGVVQMSTPGPWQGWGVERVSEGMGTVVLGMLLLGNTTGWIGWEMWLLALTMWPVLLVSAGIGLLGRAAGQPWIRALAAVPIWIALVLCASSASTGIPVPGIVLSLLGIG